jgi:hypothetical protein
MPTLMNPKKYAMLLLAMLLILYPQGRLDDIVAGSSSEVGAGIRKARRDRDERRRRGETGAGG